MNIRNECNTVRYPTNSIIAEAVTVDGFALSQKDTSGVVITFTHRSTGYVYSRNGATQQTVTTGYGADGSNSLHGGAEKQFTYEYLPGTHLLQKLNKL